MRVGGWRLHFFRVRVKGPVGYGFIPGSFKTFSHNNNYGPSILKSFPIESEFYLFNPQP